MISKRDRIKADKFLVETISNIEWTLKKMDAIEFQKMMYKKSKGIENIELELLLNSIKDVKGMKTKDLTDSPEHYTEEELNEDEPYDLEAIQIYLGLNQHILIELQTKIITNFFKFTEEKNKKKAT